jgi:hypothetical protein
LTAHVEFFVGDWRLFEWSRINRHFFNEFDFVAFGFPYWWYPDYGQNGDPLSKRWQLFSSAIPAIDRAG